MSEIKSALDADQWQRIDQIRELVKQEGDARCEAAFDDLHTELAALRAQLAAVERTLEDGRSIASDERRGRIAAEARVAEVEGALREILALPENAMASAWEYRRQVVDRGRATLRATPEATTCLRIGGCLKPALCLCDHNAATCRCPEHRYLRATPGGQG